LFISVALDEPSSVVLAKISILSVIAWAYLTVAGTVVGFATYIWLLRQVTAAVVATYTFVNPIIAVLLGWAFLGEGPCIWMILGATLVIGSVGGMLLAQRSSTTTEGETWTEQKQSRLILESAADYAIMTLDIAGYVTSWNIGAQKILSYSEAEILDRPGAVIFTSDDRAVAASRWNGAGRLKQGGLPMNGGICVGTAPASGPTV
jgi:hypothetical protein